jgi:FG-GAP-like repeat
LAEFNHDGSQDLVVTNGTAASISVLLGKGDGTFRAPLLFGTINGRSIAVSDFDSSGIDEFSPWDQEIKMEKSRSLHARVCEQSVLLL